VRFFLPDELELLRLVPVFFVFDPVDLRLWVVFFFVSRLDSAAVNIFLFFKNYYINEK
jgi:hypothetical protein